MSASCNWLRGCIVGIAAAGIIASLGGYLFGDSAQVLFFVVPVLAAWSGGLVAGLFATGLSAVLGTCLFIDHTGFNIPDPADRARICTFIVVGSLISWLIESLD